MSNVFQQEHFLFNISDLLLVLSGLYSHSDCQCFMKMLKFTLHIRELRNMTKQLYWTVLE